MDIIPVPKPLFKYYDANTAIDHVLGRTTVKWSTPFEFNDPFDNQFELHMEPVTDAVFNELISIYQDGTNLDSFRETGLLQNMSIEKFQSLVKLLPKSEIEEAIREGISGINEQLPTFRENFMAAMANTVILCLTESHTNLLMWAHYAQMHTGIAIAFSPKDEESPLPLAKQVKYSLEVPRLTYKEFLKNPRENSNLLIEKYTLTKSREWEYEKEWRIVVAGGGGVRPYAAEEVDAIYLGCRISMEHKEKILDIAQAKYPKALIYESSKSPTCFALEFKQIR